MERGISGGKTAAPIARAFFDRYLKVIEADPTTAALDRATQPQ